MYTTNWEWVIDCSPHTGQPKTQITLPANPGYQLRFDEYGGLTNIRVNDRIICARGRQEYLFPQGGKREAVARILVTQLHIYDTRLITDEQAQYEGYSGAFYYLRHWVGRQDPAAAFHEDLYRLNKSGLAPERTTPVQWVASLQERDSERYKGIAVVFRKVADL